MIPSVSIGPRTLLNDCNHSATAIFWRSAIVALTVTDTVEHQTFSCSRGQTQPCAPLTVAPRCRPVRRGTNAATKQGIKISGSVVRNVQDSMDPGDTRETFSVLMTLQADNEHDVLVLLPPTSFQVPTGTTNRRAIRTSCVEVMRTEALAPRLEKHHKLKLGCRNNAKLRKGTKVATVFALKIIVVCILLAFCIC